MRHLSNPLPSDKSDVNCNIIVSVARAATYAFDQGLSMAVKAAMQCLGDLIGIGSLLSAISDAVTTAVKWCLEKVANITPEAFGIFVAVHAE